MAVESHLKAKGKVSASLAGAFRRGAFSVALESLQK